MFLFKGLKYEKGCSSVRNYSENSRNKATVKRSNALLFGVNILENFPNIPKKN